MSNDPKNPNAANAAHAGYHSAHDARQMQAMARALLEGRRPIALSAASTATLEHYSRLLVRDLRQQENVRIVAHQPGSTEQLVQQVNALVADVRVDHVIDRGAAAGRPVHVFVVHDGPQLSNAEFTLLLRLVNDLPGANLRIVLVQDGDTDLGPRLAALGPQALHWQIGGKASRPAAASEAARVSLQEALREAPGAADTGALPAWAQPASQAPRRRWRLAFWRRDTAAGAAPSATRSATRSAAASAVKPSLNPSVKPGAKPAAQAAPKSAARPAATAVAKAAAKSAPKAAPRRESPKARSNRMVLVGGVFLSAALAGALGMWLQMHQPAPRAAKSQPAAPALPAAPKGATPSTAATLAAIAPR
ncbi:hypothetical protein ACT80S_12095 [Ramlibacter sp. MAHUQ-53]|uniref:hypothetical protein n=1 Tax=unclassified Ramlibacter TaxID=2617605 RepID=UPI003636CD68